MPVLTVRARPGMPSEGFIRAGTLVMRCALGKGGIRAIKREGDGATPLGRFRLLGVYLQPRRFDRQTMLPVTMTRPDQGWCDAPGDPNYNRPVRLPFPASHERMWRTDRLYDAVVVLDCNIRPRKRGMGSAIFLHVARPGYQPTEGCVAVAERDLRRLLPLLSRTTVLVVAR
ncbi:MAG: L,D-transpeptidase family protein [Rhizobiaceae bacterium]|nr:L,D-transpeptidase family protein [Rhizobiaceae bacterium]MCV0407648.1 L,D-transpeptidase family protein [Rhizobiaceae bacterium]